MTKKLAACLTVLALIGAAALPAFAEGPDGKALYDGKCAMCHGKDGVAKAMAKGSRNFNDAEFQKLSADEIVKVTTEGKNKMPAYKEKLKAEEIQAIATYVKTIK